MRLMKVEIRDYKSVRHSYPFEVGEITCLVGKNESGKTAILQALYKLNPVVPEHGGFDVTDEYPRSEVEEYRQRVEAGEEEPATVVEAEYALDDDEVAAVEAAYGAGVLTAKSITLSKGYDNKLYVEVKADEAAAVRGLVEAHGLSAEVAAEAVKCEGLEALKDCLDEDGMRRQQQFASAKAQAEALSDPDAKQGLGGSCRQSVFGPDDTDANARASAGVRVE